MRIEHDVRKDIFITYGNCIITHVGYIEKNTIIMILKLYYNQLVHIQRHKYFEYSIEFINKRHASSKCRIRFV